MKYLFAILMFPSLAFADICESLGTYAFALVGCPQSELGVDTKIPLCQQEQWKDLAWMDDRCYTVEIPWDPNCTDWLCSAPYDRVMRETISGAVKTFPGARELVDWNYRAARAGQAAAKEEVRKLSKKKKR